MKTIVISLAGLVLLAAGIVRAEEFDFRQARWGMSPDEVRKSETEAVLFAEMEGVLSYQGTIGGVEAVIFYLFRDNRLERGVYSIEPVDPGDVIGAYQAAHSFLFELHGQPPVEKLNLEDVEEAENLDPTDLEELLKLVLAKAAAPMTYWETESTEIYLRLDEKDGRGAIQVDYISRNR